MLEMKSQCEKCNVDLPKEGEVIQSLGWRFEVVDMDGRRIDKVLAVHIDPPKQDEDLSG